MTRDTTPTRTICRKHLCRCRTCPECGWMYGWRVRQNLLAQKGKFRRPMLLTLTVDRNGTVTGKGFASPQEAHRHVTDGKFISTLMRRLGVKRWVWVLEFQMTRGDGWPHWHLLIDVADLPRQRLDLHRAWALWRDTWRIGGIDLEHKRNRNGSRVHGIEHAIRYITKYLTKAPQHGYPEWVLNSMRMRFVDKSTAIDPLVSRPKARAAHGDEEERAAHKEVDDRVAKPRAPARPYMERMAECGESCTLFAAVVDHATGEERLLWRGRLLLAQPALLELWLSKQLTLPVRLAGGAGGLCVCADAAPDVLASAVHRVVDTSEAAFKQRIAQHRQAIVESILWSDAIRNGE